MDKGYIDKFKPVFVIGLYDGNPAIKPCCDEDMVYTTLGVAGMLTALVECVVDAVPEPDQVEFEQEVMKLFKKLVKTRYNRTNKLKLDEYTD